MATTRIESVMDDEWTGYERGTDWTDPGTGSIGVVAGSSLEAALLLGRTLILRTAQFSVEAPAGPFFWALGTDSALIKIATPGATTGDLVNILQLSLHITEMEGTSGQTRIRFEGFADDATVQALDVGDFIQLTLSITGTVAYSYSWKGIVDKREAIVAGRNRLFAFTVYDFWSLIRESSTDGIPREAQAKLTTIPGAAQPPQVVLGGPEAYTLQDLLTAVVPATCGFVMNCPDVLIERMPARADAVNLVIGILKTSGYIAWWDGNILMIESHEHTGGLVSAVLTDSVVIEASRQIGSNPGTPGPIERVIVERPETFVNRKESPLAPDRSQPPMGSTGRAVMPSENRTQMSAQLLYQVNKSWTPNQFYSDAPPGPIMFAFGDPEFNTGVYTAQQIHSILSIQPGNCLISPPMAFTDTRVNGYNGYDYYFLVRPVFTLVQEGSDFIAGWVVSRTGYYDQNGAVNPDSVPIAGAIVTLMGTTTGVVYTAITNADGYYRIDNAEPDKYSPSVYVPGDTYLANKHDAYTEGHPYDADPLNDELGPDNRVPITDLFEQSAQQISFSLIFNPAGVDPPDTETNADVPQVYRAAGSFDYGNADKQALVLDDFRGMAYGIDTANVTNAPQADQLAETLIDQSSEDMTSYVVTKIFGGATTRCGNVVRLALVTDTPINEDVRIRVREIDITDRGLVREVISSTPNLFIDKLDLQYASRERSEAIAELVQDKVRTLFRRMQTVEGLLPAADQLGGL
jgi:hypothetical protein